MRAQEAAYIADLLERIGVSAHHDPAAAHGYEDELYCAVLQFIAAGLPDAPEMASAALMSKRLEFPRQPTPPRRTKRRAGKE